MNQDYIEFQERTQPLAYLITIRCYGTWLHGDSRGSMDRKAHRIYGTPKIPPRDNLKNSDSSQLKSSAVKFSTKERKIVEEAIKEVCEFCNYELFAINVRTNHVHIVAAASGKPEPVMSAFKSYATRKLRSNNLVDRTGKIWSRHGSTRYLWIDRHIEAAIDYVLYGQNNDVLELK
jgi:REP element-mobilizing transposase RayT